MEAVEQFYTKAEMDEDLISVLDFMQKNIRQDKLLHIADNLPYAAKLTWDGPQFQKTHDFDALAIKLGVRYIPTPT